MKTKQVAVGDSIMNVVDAGSGQSLLFVHGFPLDHSMWRFQLPEFARRYRVICPDLSGFGESPASQKPISMMSFADELAQLLDALQVNEPVVFCGLSMGGYIGWQFWKNHSDRLSHLVACDTRAANDSPEIARARKIAAQSVRNTGTQPVADAMVEKLFFQRNDPATKPVVDSVYDVMLRTEPESIACAQLAMADRLDATSWLPEIKIPVLFVVGEHDIITPPQEMRANADLVANADFFEIGEAGHLAPLEQPIEFNQRLATFLDRN